MSTAPLVASLTFIGAAGTVTGSKTLLEIPRPDGAERRILVDAGLFQGEKQWRLKNWADFPVPPETISDIVITHAHLDHCGYLPALVARGFTGPVWCTAGTAELAAIVLRDAAMLQDREARDAASGGWSKHKPPLPVYTSIDVEHTLPMLTPCEYDAEVLLGDDVTVRFTRAGHILGSASVTVRAAGTSVLFSGDLGRHDHPVLRSHDTPPGATYVVMESTYGDREHPEPRNLPHEILADTIRRTVAKGGSVLIPAFAIDRTEVVLRVLDQMRIDGRIPDVPIYVNSPMATAALAVYRKAGDELRPGVTAVDFANVPGVDEVKTAEDSMALTRRKGGGPSIIISSSGMATGGRVMHHLEAMLPNAQDAVVLTGYQGVGTRGRALLEGARELKFHGRYLPVRAEVVQDSEFSVHADGSDLVDWVSALEPPPATIFLNHGEQGSSEALAKRLRREGFPTVVVPKHGERVLLMPSDQLPVVEPVKATEAAPAVGATLGSSFTVTGAHLTSDLKVVESAGHEFTLEGTIRVTIRKE